MNETMDMQCVDIQTILPQRSPMVMVDRLVCADEKSAETVLDIRQDNIFVEDGVLKSYAMIENMAQTCAAQLGFLDGYLHDNHDVRIGYIGAVKRMQILSVPRVGETLRTRITVQEDFVDMKLVSAESYVGEQLIATAELTIALSGERIEA